MKLLLAFLLVSHSVFGAYLAGLWKGMIKIEVPNHTVTCPAEVDVYQDASGDKLLLNLEEYINEDCLLAEMSEAEWEKHDVFPGFGTIRDIMDDGTLFGGGNISATAARIYWDQPDITLRWDLASDGTNLTYSSSRKKYQTRLSAMMTPR